MVGDTREAMTTGNMKVLDATTQDGVNAETVAQNIGMGQTPMQTASQPVSQPAADASASRQRTIPDAAPPTQAAAQNDKPVFVPTSTATQPQPQAETKTAVTQPAQQQPAPVKNDTAKTEAPKTEPAKPDATASGSTVDLGGSIVAYATAKPSPVVPAAARVMRASGMVQVNVTVDEKGDVIEVGKTTGPSLLQAAAKDAIKKWKFKPYMRDGQPVKTSGFVSFNFAL
jgi:protein TonB